MATGTLRIAVGQMDCTVGDVGANLATMERLALDAARRDCRLIVFPELATSGYAIGPGFANASILPHSEQFELLKRLSNTIAISAGFIEETEDTDFYNSALFLESGHVRHVHRKIYLPNYRQFDERRYFGGGRSVQAFATPWCRMAMLICGDAWHLSLPYLAAHDGANVLLVLAASSTEGLTPDIDVRGAWERMNQSYALTLSNFVVFSNRAGGERMGEHDLKFWGGSHVCLPNGEMAAQAAIHDEDLLVAELDLSHLRHQRLILPFRRDDSLEFTLDNARHVQHAKSNRRNGIYGLVSSRNTAFETDDGSRADRPEMELNY